MQDDGKLGNRQSESLDASHIAIQVCQMGGHSVQPFRQYFKEIVGDFFVRPQEYLTIFYPMRFALRQCPDGRRVRLVQEQ